MISFSDTTIFSISSFKILALISCKTENHTVGVYVIRRRRNVFATLVAYVIILSAESGEVFNYNQVCFVSFKVFNHSCECWSVKVCARATIIYIDVIDQVMVFIGNGFDISVLKKYGKGITTSYDSFYSFFKYKYPDSKDNLLIQQMETAKIEGKENWSDFEALLNESLNWLSKKDKELADKFNADLSEIQQAFSQFLNDIIDNDIIKNISKVNNILIEPKMNCAIKLLKGSFLKDLSKEQYEKNSFHNKFNNNETLKYIFINFNYTSLLDNYLYLTKEVFDPIPYVTSSNNITLNLNPNNYGNHCGYSDPYVQLMPIDIFHPHGIQDVPKSLLFGIENCNYYNQRDCRRVFVKSLWAQCEPKYEEKFSNTELFIVYGSSIGESDSWWWHRVFDRLVDENPAELIIYNYGSENEDVIKERFIRNCGLKEYNDEKSNRAKGNIYVVNFDSTTDKKQEFISLPELD